MSYGGGYGGSRGGSGGYSNGGDRGGGGYSNGYGYVCDAVERAASRDRQPGLKRAPWLRPIGMRSSLP